MSQTTWIIGGGVLIVLLAAVLYFVSGDELAKVTPAPITTATATPITSQPQTITMTPDPVPANTGSETSQSASQTEPTKTEAQSAVLHTSMGDITLKFYPKDAPKTVENFVTLAAKGFYDGVKFHRVIKGFMIQSGDPLTKDDTQMERWGTGGPGYRFADEITATSAIYQRGYKHGVLAMGNAGPNTNGSQFFIMATDYPLPPLYTIFGEVTSGLNIVDAIDNVQTDGSAQLGGHDRPLTPVVIQSVELK